MSAVTRPTCPQGKVKERSCIEPAKPNDFPDSAAPRLMPSRARSTHVAPHRHTGRGVAPATQRQSSKGHGAGGIRHRLASPDDANLTTNFTSRAQANARPLLNHLILRGCPRFRTLKAKTFVRIHD